MPATPPLKFDKPMASIEEITPTGGVSHFAGTGTNFTTRYDKLVIAVGAYSQSEHMSLELFTVDRILISIQAFDVPGVKAFAHFLKDVRYVGGITITWNADRNEDCRDARRIRTRILECKTPLNELIIRNIQLGNLQVLNKPINLRCQMLNDVAFSTSVSWVSKNGAPLSCKANCIYSHRRWTNGRRICRGAT